MYLHRNDKNKQVEILAAWARKTFNMTAEVNEKDITSNEDKTTRVSPCSLRFFEIKDVVQDQTELCHFCQHHSCSDYCLRIPSHSSKNGTSKKRKCRMGCGEEDIPNSGKTPGWKISSNDVIEKDGRGFKKLLLRRNHPRILQSSLFCLQSWRANCDISIMIYGSDPKFPDLYEIAEVTDYVVSYACKGNEAYAIEK